MGLEKRQAGKIAILWRQQFTEVRFQPGGYLSGRPVRVTDYNPEEPVHATAVKT